MDTYQGRALKFEWLEYAQPRHIYLPSHQAIFTGYLKYLVGHFFIPDMRRTCRLIPNNPGINTLWLGFHRD